MLHDWVTGNGTLPPEEWAWDELGAFLSLAKIPYVNLLLSTYWTMGAVRHGDYVAKVRIAPVKEFADRVVWRAMDVKSAPDAYRPALAKPDVVGPRPAKGVCACRSPHTSR